MFKFNRKVEYALISLKFLNELKPGELASASDICERHQIPYDPTSRVLQILVKNKLLRSEHGIQGGYQISKDLNRVSILELSEILTGKSGVTRCTSGKTCEISKKCNIITPLTNLNAQLVDFFNNISLRNLFDTPNTKFSTMEEVNHG